VTVEIVRLMLDLGQRRDETARWISKSDLVMVKGDQLRLEVGRH